MSQAHKISADVLWPSHAYNMAACNKLPAACPQDDWALLFVLLSLYYYPRAAFMAILRRRRMRAHVQSGLACLPSSLSRFYHSINYKPRMNPRAFFSNRATHGSERTERTGGAFSQRVIKLVYCGATSARLIKTRYAW